MKLAERIARLDPKEDNHWTDDGLPSLTQFDKGTTREAVTRLAPDLTREAAARALSAKPEPEPEPEEKVDRLALALVARDEAMQAANDASIARDRADQALKDAYKASAEAQRLVEVHTPPQHSQNAIQAYIASQNSIREERSARAISVRAAGLTLTDLTGKSKLDLAMERKNTRGTQRPARHVS